jgi:hypothetical protein
METAVRILLAVSGALTLACWISLWRGRDPLLWKLVWTVVSAAPVLGPLLYAGVHDPPPVQDDVDRAQGPSSWDVPPRDHSRPP